MGQRKIFVWKPGKLQKTEAIATKDYLIHRLAAGRKVYVEPTNGAGKL